MSNIQGDRALWVLTVVLALFSLMPVFSASSNIAFLHGSGNTFSMLAKHMIHLCLGLILLFGAHKLNYKVFGPLSMILLPIAIILLAYTLIDGHSAANANRWIKIPLLGWTFQTSAFASVVLLIYLARSLSKISREKLHSFKQSFLPLLAPILIVCALILPANFSTAAIIFVTSMLLLFVGGYPLKNLGIISLSGIAGLGLFILLVMAFPNISNRVDTWKSRIAAFTEDGEESYQVHKAKMAIAQGNVFGKGPGKSVQKNFLPQSNSDFIFAIIVEEYGSFGGFFVLFAYFLIVIRILAISNNAPSLFGKLVVLGTGLGIMIQAFVNLGVAVNIFPVTGQTLPLISAGGSSIWMNCVAIGIILSVSKAKDESVQENDETSEPITEETTNTLSHA